MGFAGLSLSYALIDITLSVAGKVQSIDVRESHKGKITSGILD